MAAAVGRGRSRGLRANSSPAPSPISNPQTNSPQISGPQFGSLHNGHVQTNTAQFNSTQINVPRSDAAQPACDPPNQPACDPPNQAACDQPNQPARDLPNQPDLDPPNPFAAPNPFSGPVTTPTFTQPAALTCMDILRKSAPGHETHFINTVKREISDPSQLQTWLNSCILQLYGNRALTQNFVEMLNLMEKDPSITIWNKLLMGLLKTLQTERDRLKPAPGVTFNEDQFCGFVELLALVGYHVKKPNGSPIYQLAPPLVECLLLISQVGYPYEILNTVHYVCLMYGKRLEEYLRACPITDSNNPLTVTQELEKLYDSFRSIVIDDHSEDRTRMLMLEVIEQRAYGFQQTPQHVIEYYQKEAKSRT